MGGVQYRSYASWLIGFSCVIVQSRYTARRQNAVQVEAATWNKRAQLEATSKSAIITVVTILCGVLIWMQAQQHNAT